MNNVYKALNSLNAVNVLVVGDIMLDRYLYGDVKRISPEAPVPVININKEQNVLGGAANVANNLYALGCRVFLCGTLGEDFNGSIIDSLLESTSINFDGIIKDNRKKTTTKTRIIGFNQQMMRLDVEENKGIDADIEDTLIKAIDEVINKQNINVVIISDYNKGVCTEKLCKYTISKCDKKNINVIVDPKCDKWDKYSYCDFIKPNVKELGQVVGKIINDEEEEIVYYAKDILKKYNISNILVTRSEKGMIFINNNTVINIPTYSREVFDVSGAGDTVVSVLASLLAVNLDLEDIIKITNVAAGISVRRIGTYAVSCGEIINELNENKCLNFSNKIMDVIDLKKALDNWRNEGKRIVFTNGCFDILHAGHIDYLSKSAKLGGKLIVGLNSDDSVKRLKGKFRPIIGQKERAILLAALSFIDAVIIFDEDTPEELLRFVKPDILVKGGDYKIENIVGRQYATETKVIPVVQNCSTTGIISKVASTIERDD